MERATLERTNMAAKNPSRPAQPAKTQSPTTTPMPMGSDPAGQSRVSKPNPDEVARRAYERYQQRGGGHGSDQQDWYEAERDLSQNTSSGSSAGHKQS
jgi:hypothetical protein